MLRNHWQVLSEVVVTVADVPIWWQLKLRRLPETMKLLVW